MAVDLGTALGAIAFVPTFAGVGVGIAMANPTRRELLVAKACFVMGAIAALACYFLLTSDWEMSAQKTALTGIFGAATAIFLMVGLEWVDSKEKKILQNEMLSSRPVFEIKEPGIKPLPKSPTFRILIKIENVGEHPSDGLEGELIFIEAETNKTMLRESISVASLIRPKIPTSYWNDSLVLGGNVPKMYVLLGIKYSDAFSSKAYGQIFYMKWSGVKDGDTQPDFVHVTKAEKEEIIGKNQEFISKYINSN
jgi:hypothetical protein